MASRHEIISIDFRANAAKANPAMDALRESAKNMRTEVEKTKTAISDGIKTGKSQEELDKLGAKLRTQERELKSFETAMNTLAKGVTTLSRAIDAFNTGTLDQMSAAFQKASYNAAESAKKALLPGTEDYQKNMAELDALQQKNLENLAKYKLRTEQMLQSIGKEGSKISSQDLKQEADGIQELMRLLPHMSHEWLEYNDILKQVNAAIKQQTDDEKRLTGAIVDANDARERSSQLTRKGVEEAARQRKEAEEEVKQRTENIAALKEERAEKAKQVSIDAANAIAKDKEVEKQRKVVAAIQDRIDNEKKNYKAGQELIDELNQEAEAYDKTAKASREAADTMKAEVKGIDDELKQVNEELAKMGTSAGPAAAGAAKEKEAQSTDKSAEAAKKEQQASKDSAAAKKEETKATEENIAAKEKEVKAGETAAKAAENEKVTVESLIKRNDELKIKIAALNEERKQMLATQEKNAAAVKEEANAYKDLSKEQAQAMLDQKQQLATFKKEGEKWQIGNREEAQRYLFDALGEINPANVGKTTMSIESSPEKISQLLGKFQERYGIEGEGEAMAAVRELMSGGGLVKSGFMNKFFMNVEEDVPKVAAYSKEIKDLTAVINGEVKAVEEDTEKKRTLADVEAELKAAEKESRDISIQTMKMRNGQADATEGLTQKTVKLTDAQKERIATIKAETEAIRQMSQEEAKAALEEAKKVSTVGYKAGKLHMSDPEEVQQFLIGKMRTIGKVKNDNGTLSLAGGQVDALVSAFQQRYGWKDDKTNAKALLKKILQGKDGMFMGGTADLNGDVGSVTIQYAKEMYDARIERAKALVDVSNGVKKATDDVSDATRRGADAAKDATEATKGQTDAIKAQEAEVMRRKAAFDKMNEEYEQADKKLKDMRRRYASLPSSGADAALAKAQLKDEIDDYNESVVKKARADKNRLKKLWEQSAKDLTAMIGISTEETQKSTAAQNQETEAVEKGTKGRGRKKKAVEDVTQAVREEAKAEGDAAKQSEQLSEQDRKRIDLEQKKQELETKRGQKIDEITKKEEDADAAMVRANNNRSEALQMTEELSQAHGKNADDMAKATDELKKLEFEQDGLNKKADEGRKALAEYDQKIDDNAEKRLEAQKKQAQAQRLTIDTMTEAIKVLEARNRAIEPESEEWVKNARLIRQYQAELDRLKQQPVLDMMTERMGSIRNLSADALQETKKFWQGMITGAEHGSTELKEYERNLEKVAKEEEKRRQEIQAPMRKRLNNLEKLSTADLAETKRYWETVRDGVSQTSAAYKKAELAVKALTNEENRRKANAQAQYINEQMRDLNNLSTAGLTEVKRYWQAMADGARKGTDEAKDAEAALKRINEIESERRRTADKQQVRTLFGDLSKKNGEEIRAAIEAGRRLIDTYDSGGPAAKRLSQAILDAEEHLKQYGIEAERSARREAQALEEAAQRRKEQDQLMRQQLDQGTSLSESALKTQQQYWQRLIDDPKTAKESLAGYRYELERIIALQKQQASVTREERAARLNGDLRDYSTAEIKESIEAAKQLAASYKSGSTEATELTQKIVAAEEHLNKFSIEAARKVKKENDELQEQQATLAKSQTGGFDGASMDQLDEAIKRLKAYRALIENPSTSGKGTFDDVTAEIEKLTAQLDALKGKTDKAKTAFQDADEVMQRFSEHMKGTVVTTPGQSIDEQLSQHVSMYDDYIKDAAESTDFWEQQVKEATAELDKMEKELAELEKKHANSSWFRKQTSEYKREGWRIERLKKDINGETFADGTVWGGQKEQVKHATDMRDSYQQNLDYLKQQKAEALGLVEVEEQVQKARRMTREEMQEGIKVLEAEAMAQDRSTADGQKRWEELRKTIGEMNQELKEATGEWMKLADAQKIAEGAGKKGFAASAQEIQQATQALERRREELIKQIRAERDLGNAVDAQEKELDDLTKKLRSLKFEQDNVNMSQEKMRTLIETPANAVNLDELRAAIKRADGQLRQMEQSLGQNSSEYKRFAEQVRQAKNVMKEMEGQAKASATAWEKAFNRLKTYVVMYMGFNEVWQKMSNTARDLMDLSDRMGEVGKTTQMTAEQIGRLTDNLKKIDTRTSLVALTELSAKAGQLGLKSAEDVMGFTEAANKMLVALPEMGADGATQMMKVALATGEVDKIRKQMEEGTIDGSSATAVAMEKIASTIDQLRANSAAAAPQITDFVKRVGAVGAQSGITIDQVAALGSTVDALGMRVEMSATALSRMIPAIKRNAFDVAHAIGMAPEALRAMFDEAGGGMNAMLAIFQHIKDAGMREDDIEKMLGMGEMAEIMKELNQQGARAGIVFAGLSQNVDVLREHLGIANKAYEENIAIQREYDRMNETTAAKWERLKNQFEEMWVGDQAQRWLGYIVDGLREIVDLISGPLNGALVGLAAGYGTFKAGIGGAIGDMLSFGEAENDAGSKWEELWEKIKEKNVWDLVVSGAVAAGVALWQYMDSLQEAAREQARFNREVVEEQDKLEDLTKSINTARESVNTTTKDVEAAKKEVEAAKAALDGTKESTDRLTEANSKLLVAEEKKRSAMVESKRLIGQFNNEYSKYLGFMLSEVSTSYELEKARDLLNTKIRETISLKRKEAALGRIEEEEGEARDNAYSDLSVAISGAFRRQVVVGHDANGKEIKEWTADRDKNTRLLRNLTKMAQQEQLTAQQVEKALEDAGLKIYEATNNGEKRISAYGANIRNLVMNYRKEYQDIAGKVRDVETQFEVEASIDREETQGKLAEQYKASEKRYAQLETSHAEATGEARKKAAADLLKQADTLEEMITAAPNYYDLRNNDEKASYEKFVSETQARIDGIKNQREALLKEAGKYYTARDKAGGGRTTSIAPVNPFGSNAPADSTDYSLFDVNELVARRNQMDKFKNILKPDTDVRTVLAEDKALMKALDNGLKSDWKSVLDWYNAERKKIQEELKSERFSTNTGHWRDEKNGRGRKNRFRESDYALAELDRYYSRRKEKLEKAREEEGMSEELFNREAELLEQEHLERRSKLRETFTAGTSKQEREMVAQFRLWWDKLEKSGDLDEVPWATVESEWAQALASEIGRNNLKAQQDLTQLQSITVKHLNAIAKLIDQERPYDGITANLRKNLTEMDILLADMVKDGPAEDTAKLVSEQGKRLQFLLTEAEHAYALTFDDLAKKMREQGLGDWADALMIDEQKKQSLMQNLRNVYDQIQEAIKKEASIIKKQLEIQWNDMLPGQEMSMKGTFEKAISDLGLAGDQVKRANSLIGAGAASERVADKLAIQQMKVQLAMQQTYFALMQKIGDERVRQLRLSAEANDREAKALKTKAEQLRKEGKITEAETKEREAEIAARQALQDSFDAEHAQKSLNLAKTKEIAEEEKQRVAIQNQLEESQNRLYTSLREWADLLTSSLQGVFEASHAGDAEYYNERAKLDLTGKGGPGAGTYVVIDDAGTSDATAHYEYLDERQALERQHEIEIQNAQAEAWRKLMDDLNMKMSEQITDWMNAYLQNKATEDNTAELQRLQQKLEAEQQKMDASVTATDANTQAVQGLTQQLADGIIVKQDGNNGGNAPGTDDVSDFAYGKQNLAGGPQPETLPSGGTDDVSAFAYGKQNYAGGGELSPAAQQQINEQNAVTENFISNKQKEVTTETQTDKKIASTNASTFAKMTQAVNLYGIAYQAMSNDNLSTEQKFQMIALQAAGQAAIAGLTATASASTATVAAQEGAVASRTFLELGPIAGPIALAALTAIIGGLMGMAVSKIAKGKSEIAQATGASVGAGRLATGMLTYKTGNVNELTDPASLTPGRQYNVDGADGKTYRARYMGKGAKTHITNGPEFHLVGEAGREAIIDAKTTRLLQMNETGIWRDIQTLYNGGSISGLSTRRRRGTGVRAFADGNIGEFEDMADGRGLTADGTGGMGMEQMLTALDRNSAIQEALLERLNQPIYAQNILYGPEGLPNVIAKLQKEAQRHGEKYL